MVSATGVADLPLHWGHVPPWLARIMRRLAKAILEVAIIELGTEGLLRRLSNPLWFQAFNNAIGMDWDSSGSTTVTTAMIKDALNELNAGAMVAGGKGLASRRTPHELVEYGCRLGLSSKTVESLIRTSKLVAKADNALLQDGYVLYHHAMVFDERGRWVVIQQGMNLRSRYARRYHVAWFKPRNEVTVEPHSGVASVDTLTPLNMLKAESISVRKVVLDLMNERPERVVRDVAVVNNIIKGQRTLVGHVSPPRVIDRSLPYYRPVRMSNKLLKTLRRAYEIKPASFEEAILIEGVGPEVIRALSLISELIYREPPPLRDEDVIPYSPFKYAFTIGGKDGVPYPARREVAESVIRELERLVECARVGRKERILAFKALRRLAPRDVGEV